jgi:hypothetical protein
MTKSEVAPGIFIVRFKTQHQLASTFVRIQEHYESSRFRKRVFTLEEFMDWYAERFGAFTYFEDWSGFNVPSVALEPFYEGRFDPLLEKERRLLEFFQNVPEPFYVIGIAREQDLEHEIAHALYYMRPEYRRAVNAAMRRYNTKALARRLAAMGYHRSVLADEVHAYIVATSDLTTIKAGRYALLQKELKLIYRRFAPKLTPSARRRSS